MLDILGLATLVMLVMVLGVKGPQGLAQYDTHYTPEKRLSRLSVTIIRFFNTIKYNRNRNTKSVTVQD